MSLLRKIEEYEELLEELLEDRKKIEKDNKTRDL